VATESRRIVRGLTTVYGSLGYTVQPYRLVTLHIHYTLSCASCVLSVVFNFSTCTSFTIHRLNINFVMHLAMTRCFWHRFMSNCARHSSVGGKREKIIGRKEEKKNERRMRKKGSTNISFSYSRYTTRRWCFTKHFSNTINHIRKSCFASIVETEAISASQPELCQTHTM
jgi:hypothetical protein